MQATTLNQVWELARELSQTIPALAWNVNTLFEEYGLDQPGFFYILLSARRFDPDSISSARLGVRVPYTHPEQLDNLLALVAKAGFLTSKGDGEYEFTDKGRTIVKKVNHTFYTQLSEISSLSAKDLSQLEDLLKKVTQACLDAPEPAGKPCISVIPHGFANEEYTPLARIDQQLDYLNAFRDDVHLAAWAPYDISGHAWEAFTFVWRGDAGTAEELIEKLSFRGHSAKVYTKALSDLVGRGWVKETPDDYQVTDKGRALRQEAEDVTDRYFFAPWACLSNIEIAQLHDLATRLKNDLQQRYDASRLVG